MPKQLQKSLSDYISRIKKPTNQLQLSSKTLTSSTSWILKGCKHPKTQSFSFNCNENEAQKAPESATLSDIDRFLSENFKSLYQQEADENGGQRAADDKNQEKPSSPLFDSPRFLDVPANFSDSHRFFFDHSSSDSLIEEARASTAAASEEMAPNSATLKTTHDPDDGMGPDDFITLMKYSPNPYDDFRKSMQEMVDARLRVSGKVDWEFMEELLFCYLNLNDQKSYKFILNAFVDLVVGLREDSGGGPAKPEVGRSAGERRKKRGGGV